MDSILSRHRMFTSMRKLFQFFGLELLFDSENTQRARANSDPFTTQITTWLSQARIYSVTRDRKMVIQIVERK